MAMNSGRGNPIAAAEGPDKTGEGPPPPVGSGVKGALRGVAEGAGAHAGGEDAGVAVSGAEKADPKVELPPPPPPGAGEEGEEGVARVGR